MQSKIIRVIDVLKQSKIFKMLISMNSNGYLKEIGWINSFLKQMPIDNEDKPLPWVTYCFIDFIENRLTKDMNIFEYGSGNSTLWYSQNVKSVTSIEHDKKWFKKIKHEMPINVDINYIDLVYNGEYSKYALKIKKKFDIIIIDGRDRVNCVKNAINGITDEGVIVLDDSERDIYKDGINYLMDNGFKRIDFWGISPGLFYKKCTTIFYRTNNCLGI